jgi:lipoxygenase
VTDPSSESKVEKSHPVYVPRDETFEEIKETAFSTGRMKALLHNLIPALAAAFSRRDSQFECFSDIDRLYRDGFVINTEEESFIDRLIIPSVLKSFMTMGNRLLKYEVPSIISSN